MTEPDEYPDLLQQIRTIVQMPDGGYVLTADAREFFTGYLARYGFELNQLTTHRLLIDAVRHCNSEDYDKLMRKPAPEPRWRFLWNRLRKLGK